MKSLELMLVLNENLDINQWVQFAEKLIPNEGMIHVRGLVTVETEKSLSEGTLAARGLRDTLNQAAQDYEKVDEKVQIHVDYQPFQRLLEEIQEKAIDFLLVDWRALDEGKLGIGLEDLLQLAPCSLVIVKDIEALNKAQNVLLALRGGPNLSVGTYLAKAIAGKGSITLYHAISQHRVAPDFKAVMQAVPQIKRIVTAMTDIVEGLISEATLHDVIIMGTGLRKAGASPKASIFHKVDKASNKPIVLVQAAKQESLEFHPPQLISRLDEPVNVRVDRWFAENTFHSEEFSDLWGLMRLKEKRGLTISLALPALNEEETVGEVIQTLKKTLMDEVPLLDEIVLIDSNSTDRTRQIAENLGIPTYIHQEILADEVGSYVGKGEALWKSLHVTKGDIIAWVDTDISNMHPRFIYGLVGPLLKNQAVQFVKGFYARPIEIDGKLHSYGGGRVTELVARPLLNLFYPELSGIIQPLSGEYAGRRSALEQIPFFSGYGVETAMLIDILERYGLEGIAQNDLELRVHHNQPLVNLSKMSFAILQVFIARLENRYGIELLNKANRTMKFVIQEPERFALDIAEIGDQERPPIITVASYRDRHKQEQEAIPVVPV
jgi:glycosyltransferase involved in cell wall biosynthesis